MAAQKAQDIGAMLAQALQMLEAQGKELDALKNARNTRSNAVRSISPASPAQTAKRTMEQAYSRWNDVNKGRMPGTIEEEQGLLDALNDARYTYLCACKEHDAVPSSLPKAIHQKWDAHMMDIAREHKAMLEAAAAEAGQEKGEASA